MLATDILGDRATAEEVTRQALAEVNEEVDRKEKVQPDT
jgi:hypothetical protein